MCCTPVCTATQCRQHQQHQRCACCSSARRCAARRVSHPIRRVHHHHHPAILHHHLQRLQRKALARRCQHAPVAVAQPASIEATSARMHFMRLRASVLGSITSGLIKWTTSGWAHMWCHRADQQPARQPHLKPQLAVLKLCTKAGRARQMGTPRLALAHANSASQRDRRTRHDCRRGGGGCACQRQVAVPSMRWAAEAVLAGAPQEHRRVA